MAKSKKATPSRTSTNTKSPNSTNKNRTVTKSDVATAKAVVKKQLAPSNSLEEKTMVMKTTLVLDTPKEAVRPPKFEDFKPIGSLVPFRSFLPEGYVVLVNVNYITSVQNYTTHTDSVQIGLLSGTTQLVKHSIVEVLEAIRKNLS
jgi:hypothetical protein